MVLSRLRLRETLKKGAFPPIGLVESAAGMGDQGAGRCSGSAAFRRRNTPGRKSRRGVTSFWRDGAGGAVGAAGRSSAAVLSEGRAGPAAVGLERMLRIYFLQQWYGLADEALEDAVYDSQGLRDFAGIEPPSSPPRPRRRTKARPATRRCTRPRRATSGTSG